MMYAKLFTKRILGGLLIFCSALLHTGVIHAESLETNSSQPEGGHGFYLTISMALLFTFMTVFAISMLARYIRETTGDPFSGYKDSDY